MTDPEDYHAGFCDCSPSRATETGVFSPEECGCAYGHDHTHCRGCGGVR